jgi:hypothetical protein
MRRYGNVRVDNPQPESGDSGDRLYWIPTLVRMTNHICARGVQRGAVALRYSIFPLS